MTLPILQVMTSAGHASEQARPAQDVHLAVDLIPTLAWSARSDGCADFFNKRWLDYTGLSADALLLSEAVLSGNVSINISPLCSEDSA